MPDFLAPACDTGKASAVLALLDLADSEPEVRAALRDLDAEDLAARLRARAALRSCVRASELLRVLGCVLPPPELGCREVER